MSDFQKIEYYDLGLEAQEHRIAKLLGRTEELDRLTRIVSRSSRNNCMLVGASGTGKTMLFHGWAKRARALWSIVRIEAESFYGLHQAQAPVFARYQEAFTGLPSCVLFIDSFGSLVHNKSVLFQQMVRLLTPVLKRQDVKVVLAFLPHEFTWMEHEDPSFSQFFERIALKEQAADEQKNILALALTTLASGTQVADKVLNTILSYVVRFPNLGAFPRSAIAVLDEAIARTKNAGRNIVKDSDVLAVLSDKTGVPLQQLQQNDLEMVQNIEGELNKKIVNQKLAIATIAHVIQRAKLGLRDPVRPLGSFLLLGPSGVGKTETAKLIAQLVFGRKENFVRIDMSEFGQEHSVQRLLGAPPGYVGYEAGGELTNAMKAEPHSLILLDEIEKAHPKVFDAFLQVLDDGRLTSGQGETVDFRQSILMATSNLAVQEILTAWQEGADIHDREFRENVLLPVLVKRFRLEFLNRFDSIIVFNPLRLEDLLEISQLEIKKIEERMQNHRIKFRIDPATLAKAISDMADPRFGARPVKRFVEEVCETLMTRQLLQNKNQTV